jgi:hypothetical protein
MPSLKRITRSWLKTAEYKLMRQYRHATWRNRSLPDFIIIGAQKSGTSSLFNYLAQHPQLLPSTEKEVHFFDGGLDPHVDTFEKGQAWYRDHFPLKKSISTHQKTFEASPLYIFNPLAPGRIFDLIPKVKIIAVLRNPTDRAISQYFHEKRANWETLSIYDALQNEEKRLESIGDDYKNNAYIHHSYKSRGLYKAQIERYLNYFPWNQILVIASEEFFNEPHKTLKRVFEFVEVDPAFKINDISPSNVASNRSDVAPEVYEYLNCYFSSPNQALYEMVRENYGW